MIKFQSTKLHNGYSTCYRIHNSNNIEKYIHGCALSFRVWYEGDLDNKNWVVDFGAFKRSKVMIEGKNPKDYFDWLLDHTTIVAEDDPYLDKFKELNELGVIQLRVLPQVGCERFAEFIFNKIDEWVRMETFNRVRVVKVEVYEHEKNSASYERNPYLYV